LGDVAASEYFEGEHFQDTRRKISMRLHDVMEFIRNVDRQLHALTDPARLQQRWAAL